MTIPDPTADMPRNALQLLNFLLDVKRTRQAQAQADIASILPGGQIDPKQFKRAYGRAPKASELMKPETFEHLSDVKLTGLMQGASPQQNDMILNSMLSQHLGVPQIATGQALTTQAQAAEIEAATRKTEAGTKGTLARTTAPQQIETGQVQAATGLTTAKTQRDVAGATAGMVAEGITALQRGDAHARAAMGQITAFGQTGAQANKARLDAEVSNQTRIEAMKFLKDPKTHAWGLALRQKFGINPVAAIAAIGSGMGDLVGQMAQLSIQQQGFHRDVESALEKAQANWAEDVAKNVGGKVSPADVLSSYKRVQDGKEPRTEMDFLLQRAAEVRYRSGITQAMRTGDPRIANIDSLVKIAQTAKDPRTVEAISKVLSQQTGEIMTTVTYGPRPQGDPVAAAQWDAIAAQNSQGIPGMKAKGKLGGIGGFFGMFNLEPSQDKTRTLQVGPAAPAAATQQGPGAAPAAPQATPSIVQSLFQPATAAASPTAPVSAPAPTNLQIPSDMSPEDIKTLQDLFNAYTQSLNAPKP